jgi:hypothetical protein
MPHPGKIHVDNHKKADKRPAQSNKLKQPTYEKLQFDSQPETVSTEANKLNNETK